MKLLTTPAHWRKWFQDEVGRYADQDYPAPMRFPCYGYTELVSWGQETLKPIYLYQNDVEAMALELVAAGQRR